MGQLEQVREQEAEGDRMAWKHRSRGLTGLAVSESPVTLALPSDGPSDVSVSFSLQFQCPCSHRLPSRSQKLQLHLLGSQRSQSPACRADQHHGGGSPQHQTSLLSEESSTCPLPIPLSTLLSRPLRRLVIK